MVGEGGGGGRVDGGHGPPGPGAAHMSPGIPPRTVARGARDRIDEATGSFHVHSPPPNVVGSDQVGPKNLWGEGANNNTCCVFCVKNRAYWRCSGETARNGGRWRGGGNNRRQYYYYWFHGDLDLDAWHVWFSKGCGAHSV